MAQEGKLSMVVPMPVLDEESDEDTGSDPLLVESRRATSSSSRQTLAAVRRSSDAQEDEEFMRAQRAATVHAHQMIFEDAVASMCQAPFVFGMVGGYCLGMMILSAVSVVIAHKRDADAGWNVFSLTSLLLLFAVCILAVAFFVREISKGEYRAFGRHYLNHKPSSRKDSRTRQFTSDEV